MESQDTLDCPVGIHTFTAYDGDVQWTTDPETGLQVPDREALWEQSFRNIITTNGKGAYLDRLAGLGSVAAFTSLGVGAGTVAPAVGDTQLGGGASVLLKACDATFPSRSGTVLTYRATFASAEANFVWSEAGIFNGTSNGTSVMFNRVAIGPFTKTAGTSIVYSTTITQS